MPLADVYKRQVLNGANKQKMYDRTLVFEGKKAADGDAYTVIKNTPKKKPLPPNTVCTNLGNYPISVWTIPVF